MKFSQNALLTLSSGISLASAAAIQARDSPQSQLQLRDTNATYWPYQTFKTEPKLHPPKLQITKSGAPLGHGYLFFGPGMGLMEPGLDLPKQTSPLIMTDNGDLVWSAKNGTYSTNFKVQTWANDSVLSYWSGIQLPGVNVGHFYGSVTVLNSSYDTIATVCPKDLDLVVLDTPEVKAQHCHLDGHESVITNAGQVIFTAYNITTTNLSSVGGPTNGSVWDCLFYVYDLSTMKQLYRWSALAHVPVSQTKNPIGGSGLNASDPFDYFHINSVQPIYSSTNSEIIEYYLVNSRHTWSTYLVNAKTSKIVWTIAGDTGGDFGALASNSHFRWQHDARLELASGSKDAGTDPVRVRYFNNYNAFQQNGTAPSNGLSLALTPPKGKANGTNTFIQADQDPAGNIYSDAQGSNDPLDNGNRLVYYGFTPVAQEYGPQGDVRLSLAFGQPNGIQSYRMFRQAFKGYPRTKPKAVAVNSKNNTLTGYVSWNGATEVTNWQVYEGTSKTKLTYGALVAKRGFETKFSLKNGTMYFLIEALQGNKPLRNSSLVTVGS